MKDLADHVRIAPFRSRTMLKKRGVRIGGFLLGASIGIIIGCDRLARLSSRAGKRSWVPVIGVTGRAEDRASIEQR